MLHSCTVSTFLDLSCYDVEMQLVPSEKLFYECNCNEKKSCTTKKAIMCNENDSQITNYVISKRDMIGNVYFFKNPVQRGNGYLPYMEN